MSQIRALIDDHLTGIADVVREAVAHADANLATATHEVRKALRRARAIVDLIGDELPGRDRRAVRKAIRQARRGLGPARDQTVAPRVLAQLALDEGDRDVARAAIESAAVDVSTDQTRIALAAAAACATEQVMALHSALPSELESEVLVDGVRSLYRRARRARKGAGASRRGFHQWRRRTKELIYQLDLLSNVPAAADVGKELDELGDAQSAVVDLIMLRDRVRRNADKLDGAATERIVAVIDAELAPRMDDARRAGKLAFARRPKELAKLLAEPRSS